MRPRRLLVVLAITAGLWAPREAAAFCDAPGPYLGTGAQLPLACPVHVYVSQLAVPGQQPPRITVLRDGTYADVTGDVFVSNEQLQVEQTLLDCELRVTNMSTAPLPYVHQTVHLEGVEVGDRIGVGQGWFGGIEIVAAGPCAAPIMPRPACTELPPCGVGPPFEEDFFPQGGCGAGAGGAGLLPIGAALIALIGRIGRPRAARRRRR